MRTDLAGATGARAESLRVTGHALVEMRQWTFLLGPGIMAGFNALFLGYVMYRSRLVPRIIPTIGLIGAPLILASSTATIFGLWDQVSSPGSRTGPSGRYVGVLPRRVADRQGLQARSSSSPSAHSKNGSHLHRRTAPPGLGPMPFN